MSGDFFKKAIETINEPQLTYVVTVQDRLKVNIQGRQVGIYNRQLGKCAEKSRKRKDSVMFVLDRSATYTNTGLTKYEAAYKRAVAAGVQCALQDQLIRKDFYSNLYSKQVRSFQNCNLGVLNSNFRFAVKTEPICIESAQFFSAEIGKMMYPIWFKSSLIQSEMNFPSNNVDRNRHQVLQHI